MTPRGLVAITGASGLVGGRLCARFSREGWTVRALVRDPAAARVPEGAAEVVRASLPDALDARVLDGADVVVHAAYATRATDADAARRVNEEGTRRVRDAARASGVRRLVFVSSLAARADAPSYYARSKHALEAELDASRDLVVRPGLVLGLGTGLFERLVSAVDRSPVVPLFDGGRQLVQTVHVDDLATAVLRAVETELVGAVNVAEPEGLLMRDFVRAVARWRGRRPLVLPVPLAPALAAVRLAERVGLRLPVGSENLLGLSGMRHVPTAADLARLGLTLRTAEQSLADLLVTPLRRS